MDFLPDSHAFETEPYGIFVPESVLLHIVAVCFTVCLSMHMWNSEKMWITNDIIGAVQKNSVRDGKIKSEENIYLREQEGKTVKTLQVATQGRKTLSEGRSKKGESDTGMKQYTVAEVRKHNTRSDAWLIMHDQVYDVTRYIDNHPGGWIPMSHLVGKDATDTFEAYHPACVSKILLPPYRIGHVSDSRPTSSVAADFRALRQTFLREGLFETNMWFYIFQGIWVASILSSSIALSYLGLQEQRRNDSGAMTWSHMISAATFGLFLQQLAFIGHDAAHTAVTHNRWKDSVFGMLFLQTFGGLSIGWWKKSHNSHHIISNNMRHDPDIQHLPVMAVSEKFFTRVWSTFHQKYFVFDSLARLLVSYQHLLFYPIMMVARVNLYVQMTIFAFFEKEFVAHRCLEIGSLVFYSIYLSVWMMCLVPHNWLAFLCLSHAVSGILHVQICISHFSMEICDEEYYTEETNDFWRIQTRTTMDVDCPVWMDWFHGGLQFQFVHHLFPRMPRHNLRFAKKRVQELCRKHNLPYHNAGFLESNKLLLESMKKTALQARKSVKFNSAEFYSSILWEGACAQG